MVREPISRIASLYQFLRGMWLNMHNKLTHVGFRPTTMPEFHADFSDWFISNKEDARVFFSCPSLELENAMVRRFAAFTA